MATFPGTYIKTSNHTNSRINDIIDNLLTPKLMTFRQISIYDESGVRVSGNTWKLTYQSWNDAFNVLVKYNGQLVTPASIDYIMGTVTINNSYVDGDNVYVTYNIDWFPAIVLSGFIHQSVDIINNSGQASAPTQYTIDSAPSNWDGVIADLVFAMCMEKLILDYDLWFGRLIFAIGANGMDDGNSDIVGQLETLKSNAEERANTALNNEKFKFGNALSVPTQIYYNAVRGMGAGSRGAHGIAGTGRLRGYRPSKYM